MGRQSEGANMAALGGHRSRQSPVFDTHGMVSPSPQYTTSSPPAYTGWPITRSGISPFGHTIGYSQFTLPVTGS